MCLARRARKKVEEANELTKEVKPASGACRFLFFLFTVNVCFLMFFVYNAMLFF